MTDAYIGLGANLGPAEETLLLAAARIGELPATQVLRCSSHYASAPIDAGGPDYMNSVVAIKTGLSALELLASLQNIETQFGRQRPYPNAPRTLDLDLLLYGDEQHHSTTLIVPHPRMHQRAFVLEPLAQIAPDIKLPGLAPLAELRALCSHQNVTRISSS
jgi:2-amino-4-hydroxy-6-hydroxymethyldihydropteridine diphosphokinase